MNYLLPPEAISVLNLVLAKSRGKITVIAQAPASPPERTEAPRYLSLFASGLRTLMNLPKRSLRARLRAFIGKILMTLIPLPFQRDLKPSCLTTFARQSEIPVYCFLRMDLWLDWVWRISFTLSVGATVVLAMVADIPPRKKLTIKFSWPAA